MLERPRSPLKSTVVVLPRAVYSTLNGRRSQDMACVVKGCRDAWGDLEHVSVPCALESADKLTDVIGIVEWSDAGLSPPLLFLVDVAAITDLDTSRIFEHEFCQVGGGSGEVDLS